LPQRPPTPTPHANAYFEVVEPGGGGAPRNNIELSGTVWHLGREATVSDIVFNDRSVSRRHARLEAAPDGAFRIYDEGSTSGTWVNFTLVPVGEGWELRPGDLVNLGRVQLRFKRREIMASTAPPE
jgi:pSer/pThr/pTyr-binding forkhead associated (FHA) protein